MSGDINALSNNIIKLSNKNEQISGILSSTINNVDRLYEFFDDLEVYDNKDDVPSNKLYDGKVIFVPNISGSKYMIYLNRSMV